MKKVKCNSARYNLCIRQLPVCCRWSRCRNETTVTSTHWVTGTVVSHIHCHPIAERLGSRCHAAAGKGRSCPVYPIHDRVMDRAFTRSIGVRHPVYRVHEKQCKSSCLSSARSTLKTQVRIVLSIEYVIRNMLRRRPVFD